MKHQEAAAKGEIVIYQTKDKKVQIDVKLDQETLWLSQAQMARLFEKTVPTVNEHIKNIYREGELKEEATIRKFRIVQAEGARAMR